MNLNSEQRQALEVDRNLVVSAGAGSGKTRVLVERYLSIVLANRPESVTERVRSIVAITFTVKAAAEMRQRIVRRLEEKYREASTGPEAQRILAIREAMVYARISTIHSFCTSLLRDFPVEAQISPDFKELRDSQSALFKDNLPKSALEALLFNPDTHDETTELLLRVGEEKVVDIVKRVAFSAEYLELVGQAYNGKTPGELTRELEDGLRLLIESRFREPLLRGLEHLAELQEVFASSPKPTADMRELLSLRLPTLSEMRGPLLLHAEEIDTIGRGLRAILTQTGTVKKRLSQFSEHIDEIVLRLATEACKGTVSTLAGMEYNLDTVRLGRALFRVCQETAVLYEQEKDRFQALDFSDLLLKVRGILRIPDVRERVQRSIRYLMLDEFQDTDPIQYQIVEELMSPGGRYASPNLFIVGDPKQSIYAFRNADVRVFKQASDDISSGRFQHNSGPDSPIDTRISLATTYRLASQVAVFTNSLFSALMPAESSGFEVGYEPMVCGQQPSQEQRNAITLLLTIREGHNQRVGEGSEVIDETETEVPEGLSHQIARYVREHVGVTLNVKNGKPLRYRDFAILFRKRTSVPELRRIFAEQGIPAVSSGGTSLLDTQEVQDLLNLLRFLFNPADDLALAAVLRSPYVLISDYCLFFLGQKMPGASLIDKVILFSGEDSIVPIPPDYQPFLERDRAALQWFLSNIYDLSPGSQGQSLTTLLTRLNRLSPWQLVVEHYNAKEQILANVEAFFELARRLSSESFLSNMDFLAELEIVARENPHGIAEADVHEGLDAVQMLTIHGAKGLEFPVVILYDLSQKSVGDAEEFYSSRSGIITKIDFPQPQGSAVVLQKMRSALFEIEKSNEDSKRKAEEKRLLYVAITRAEQTLVLSATLKRTKDGLGKRAGLFQLIDPILVSLAQGAYSEERCALAEDFSFQVAYPQLFEPSGEARYVQQTTVTVNVEFSVTSSDVPHSAEELMVMPEQSIVEVSTATRAEAQPDSLDTEQLELIDVSGTMSSHLHGASFSASQILAMSTEAEYLTKYRLGYPLAPWERAEKYKIREEHNDDATDLGVLFHRLMQDLVRWIRPDGSVNKSALEKMATRSTFNIDISTEGIAEIISLAERLAENPWFQSRLDTLRTARHEVEVHLPFGENIVTAVIDVLLDGSDSVCEIIDWKTNRASDKNTLEALTEKYSVQMELYLYVLAHIYPERRIYTAHLVFPRLMGLDVSSDHFVRTLTFTRDEVLALGEKLHRVIERMAHLRVI